jgi:hypothetical protein
MSDDGGFEITFVTAEQFHALMQDDHDRPTPGLRAMVERHREFNRIVDEQATRWADALELLAREETDR